MKAIRGATTVDNDNAEQIRERVTELLKEIKEKNGINCEDVECITFSSTDDIHSFYPAKAAREAGFFSCALFSAMEPKITGSLKMCIRVLMFVDTDKKPVPVYLHGAAVLRKDLTQKMNIAIDGPAGSGKSTISKIIAKKLDILCLDTGAMYRACALKCKKTGVDCTDVDGVSALIDKIDIEVKYVDGVQHTYLDGKDVSEEIRSPEISMLASTVSALGCVREKMVDLQRKIAKNNSCILDGRDIGTNVLPDAQYKFYLTASAEVRAKRRHEELLAKGNKVTFDEVLSDVIKRDEQDRTRKIAPLIMAKDAILVDSSNMTVEEVVEYIERKLQEKI